LTVMTIYLTFSAMVKKWQKLAIRLIRRGPSTMKINDSAKLY
jgi:hypothetical protein